ncbi:recombinase family protein [Frankia sp. AgB32]|nr:recombinase family protein [Frankia sp. AgB32]
MTTEDRAAQRAVFLAACRVRGWEAGQTEHQGSGGPGAWAAALVRLGSVGVGLVVVVDSIDRLADTESDRVRVLALLRRRGVRLLAVADGIDTGDRIGYDLVTDVITAPAWRGVRTG